MKQILLFAFTVILLGRACGARVKSQREPDNTARIGHGTLVVAIATPALIVVATDSRRTYSGGGYDDKSRKMFRVGRRRILAIAGLADVSLSSVPGLTEQTAPLLESVMEPLYDHPDDMDWNDPPRPEYHLKNERVKEVIDRHKDDIPYFWWDALAGPIQTITNIAETFDQDLTMLSLEGLLAGFKANGEAKIERLGMKPLKGLSSWGRPYVGRSEFRRRQFTNSHLIFDTLGITQFADVVMNGPIDQSLRNATANYSAIQRYLDRRVAGTIDQITEKEAIDLCKELIRLTADHTAFVGREPIQIAVIRPNHDATVDQPVFPTSSHFLPAQGTWNLGVVFTSDYPFQEMKSDAVFTFCEVSKNRDPIPLGNNYFYGSRFDDATFIYSGGNINFGPNNTIRRSKLILAPGVDDSSIAQVRKYFDTIEHFPSFRK